MNRLLARDSIVTSLRRRLLMASAVTSTVVYRQATGHRMVAMKALARKYCYTVTTAVWYRGDNVNTSSSTSSAISTTSSLVVIASRNAAQQHNITTITQSIVTIEDNMHDGRHCCYWLVLNITFWYWRSCQLPRCCRSISWRRCHTTPSWSRVIGGVNGVTCLAEERLFAAEETLLGGCHDDDAEDGKTGYESGYTPGHIRRAEEIDVIYEGDMLSAVRAR